MSEPAPSPAASLEAQAAPPGPSLEERRAAQHKSAVALALQQAEIARTGAQTYEAAHWRRRASTLEEARRDALGPVAARARVLLSAAVALGAITPEDAATAGGALDAASAIEEPAAALTALEDLRFSLEARLSRPGPIAPDVAAAAVEAGLPFDVIDGFGVTDLGLAGPPLAPELVAKAVTLLGALSERPVLVVAEGASAESALAAARALAARLGELGVTSERLHPIGSEVSGGASPRVSLYFLGSHRPLER